MAWHDQGWPGLLALFASPVEADRLHAWDMLLGDYEIFQQLAKVDKGPFYRRIEKLSPFNTTLMKEIASAVARISMFADATEHALTLLSELATMLFAGFGQTKVIEDIIQKLRDRETRDVCNRVVKSLRQLAVMADSDGMDKHKLREVLVADSDAPIGLGL